MAALAVLLFFAVASFFFALAESALFSLGKWQARQLTESSPDFGKIVTELLSKPQDLLATIVMGNAFANAGIIGRRCFSPAHCRMKTHPSAAPRLPHSGTRFGKMMDTPPSRRCCRGSKRRISHCERVRRTLWKCWAGGLPFPRNACFNRSRSVISIASAQTRKRPLTFSCHC